MLLEDIAAYAVHEKSAPLPEKIFRHARRAVVGTSLGTA